MNQFLSCFLCLQNITQNSLEAGVDDVNKGGKAPWTMSSAESDKYVQNQRKLRFSGVSLNVTGDDDLTPAAGISVAPGLCIILCPGFAITQQEVVKNLRQKDHKEVQHGPGG